MNTQTIGQHLDVPGARLYYEVRGSGPLLLVVGQPMTGSHFARLAGELACDHTVVTYDPHGLGQSTADDPSLDVTPQVQADDLGHLIDALGAGPADVFATSGGGVTGLALAVRHPDKVRTVVSHEPSITEVLPDARYIRAVVDDVQETYRTYGAGAGWGKFVSLVMYNGLVTEAGVPPAPWPPEGQSDDAAQPEPPAPTAKQQADDELFFLHMLKPFTRYQPDVETLRSGTPQIVIAVGDASRDEIAPRCARTIAERLGTHAVGFPGDHVGFIAEPAAFAETLRKVLAGAR